MSKKLSLVALVLAAVLVLFDAPRDVVLVAVTAAFLVWVWAYGRSLVAWVAAGTHYGA